jgi:hypothetical protein
MTGRFDRNTSVALAGRRALKEPVEIYFGWFALELK